MIESSITDSKMGYTKSLYNETITGLICNIITMYTGAIIMKNKFRLL